MKLLRFITLALILAAAFGAQSLVVRSEQPPASSARSGDGPFDTLHFRPIGPASMSGRVTKASAIATPASSGRSASSADSK